MPFIDASGDTKSTILVNTNSSNVWTTPLEWSGLGGNAAHPLLLRSAAYGEMYTKQPLVRAAVDKLTSLHTALPLRVYRKVGDGREEAAETRFGRLVSCPNPEMSCVDFWSWVVSTYHVYGISFVFKQLDVRGRPVELWPLHPSRMRWGVQGGGIDTAPRPGLTEADSRNRWWFRHRDGEERPVRRDELIIFKNFNPDSFETGLSRLETLRVTLEADAASRDSQTARWRHGGQTNLALVYKGAFGPGSATAKRLAEQFERIHGGGENHHRPLVLEDGIEPVPLPTDHGLEYIQERKLNAIEVASVYDLPPRAIRRGEGETQANAAEDSRSVYRDTMPPHLALFHSAIEHDLRRPHFQERFYAEWDPSEQMRGSFEDEVKALATGIQTGQFTPAEARRRRHLPFKEGSDELFVNAAIVPARLAAEGFTQGANAGGAPTGSGVAEDGSADGPQEEPPPVMSNQRPAQRNVQLPQRAESTRSLFGYLGRVDHLADVDVAKLAELTPIEGRSVAVSALGLLLDEEASVAEFRNALKQLLPAS